MDWKKWVLTGIAGALLTILASLGIIKIPELINTSGTEETSIEEELVNVGFVIQTTQGEPIEGVKIQFIFEGAPEPRLTNTDGYATISVPKRDDIDITLTKQGFKKIQRKINLKADPRNTRIYELKKVSESEATVNPPQSNLSCYKRITQEDFLFEIDECKLNDSSLTFNLIIKNLGKSRKIFLYSDGTRLFDSYGNENFADKISIGNRGWRSSQSIDLPHNTTVKASIYFDEVIIEGSQISLLEIQTSRFKLRLNAINL